MVAPASSSSLRKWLIPDIALVLSAITMLYCLTSFGGMQQMFRDSDSGWHIRNGERVLASGQLPQADPFSFSKPGEAWFAWEWLADCTMAKAHQWDGLRGVFFLYVGVLGLVSWLWFRLLWTVNTWFIVGAASTWVMLTTSNIHWLARPHLFLSSAWGTGLSATVRAKLKSSSTSRNASLKSAASARKIRCRPNCSRHRN